jgi:hypothetical protein
MATKFNHANGFDSLSRLTGGGRGEGIKTVRTTLTSILSLQGRARKSSRVTSMVIATNEFFGFQ